MAPTVAGVGSAQADVTAINLGLPAISFQTTDVNLVVAESVGGENFTTPSGWAHIDAVSPVVQGANTQLTVFWRRWQSGDGTVALNDTGNHQIGTTLTVRGCPASGNPWNIVAVQVDAVSDNSVTFPSVTTTIADCLILLIGAWSDDMTVAALPVNANLTSITEHVDQVTTAGNDGGIFVASGIKATAGATGTSTATLSGVAFKAMMTLAMAPSAGAAATSLPLIRRNPMRGLIPR